ncbi:MAG: GntR family transcriptional regulator [Chloroflexi bacterium]|nr:GntR family transcriptional regulator [Chloroflexota bacterium]MCC6896564.1 GntR family transcriptional regulator [Anaerolineae bacterium]
MCAQLTVDQLPLTVVNTKSPVPLYYQVEADLRTLLDSEHVSAGDLLPPENELAEAYRVGRHTIRTALGRLVDDRLIVRKAGHGTVVQTREKPYQFSLARSFTRQMTDMGLHPHSTVLHNETRTILPTDPDILHAKLGIPCLLLDRLRFGGDEAIGIQHTYVILEHCPNLGETDFNDNSLYDVLMNQYHLNITEIIHTVSAVTADKRQAELLRVQLGAPLLVVKTAASLENHELIEHSLSYYRADKYEYTTTHTSS